LNYDARCLDPDDCTYDSPPTDWLNAAHLAEIACYRDFTGRRYFGELHDVTTADELWPGKANVSFGLTETGFEERTLGGDVGAPTNLYRENPSFEEPWTGTTGASALVVQTSEWADTGLYSIRITPNSASVFSSAYVAGATSSSGRSLGVLGMVWGGTYTISATIRVVAVQTGTLDPSARAINVGRRETGGTLVGGLAISPQAPNAPGVYRLKTTFTLPAAGIYEDVTLRLMNGSAVTAQPVWWDSVMVEAGETAGVWSEGVVG
jgi:hypothetical protein